MSRFNFYSEKIQLKRSKFPIASQTTTIQQLQLHPLRHQLKTRILMDSSAAVEKEARAVKMIYSQWKETVSEKIINVFLSVLSKARAKKDSTIEMELFSPPLLTFFPFHGSDPFPFPMFVQRFCDLLQPAPLTISKGIIPRHYCIFIIPTRSSFFLFLLWKTFFLFSFSQQKSEPLIFGLI
jgi:hypothetical protein